MALNWKKKRGDWTPASRMMSWAGLTLPAFAFFSDLANKVILCLQTFEMSPVRSGIFIRGYSSGNVLLCVLQDSSLSRSPHLCEDVCN